MQSFDGSGGKNEATTAEVERVLDILQKLYKQTDGTTFFFVLLSHTYAIMILL